MKRFEIEGQLCEAGDGHECSNLFIDGKRLLPLLKRFGYLPHSGIVDYLPGSRRRADAFGDCLLRDYGRVRITIEFLE